MSLVTITGKHAEVAERTVAMMVWLGPWDAALSLVAELANEQGLTIRQVQHAVGFTCAAEGLPEGDEER